MTSIESLLPPLKPESLQLFVGRLGDLYVLLSTRAGNMRTYAQDTALPGGKYEEGDVDEEGTARREAYEEIGLPIDHDKVRKLCLLDPFLTGNSLIVTPVILLITDHTLSPLLNPTEVTSLFSMPLASFLHSRPSLIPSFHYTISHRLPSAATFESVPPPPVVGYAEDEGVVGGKEGRFYGFRDVPWGEGTVRMHRFLTGREGEGVKPVYGLTAAILIHAASIGYDQPPSFQLLAPGQKTMQERIEWEVRNPIGTGVLRRAVEAEGLWDDWKDSSQEGVKAKAKL
nr:uncharacterized protein CI109_006386 [Kwoniella shandongensis]KAA5525315.1 hypothetical protein CI109_006386 [Kwoniella shandongensis]